MKAKSKEEILKILSHNEKHFKALGVKRIGLFGSYVSGEQAKNSDIDLLVEYFIGRKNYKNFLKTADLAESLLGTEVEVITPESLSPHIAKHVMKEVVYV